MKNESGTNGSVEERFSQAVQYMNMDEKRKAYEILFKLVKKEKYEPAEKYLNMLVDSVDEWCHVEPLGDEEFFNRGTKVIDMAFKHFLDDQKIPKEDIQKCHINYPDDYNHVAEFQKVGNDYFMGITFPIYISQTNEMAVYFGSITMDLVNPDVYVFIPMLGAVAVSQKQKKREISYFKLENHKDEVIYLGKIDSIAQNLRKYEKSSKEYGDLYKNYCNIVDCFAFFIKRKTLRTNNQGEDFEALYHQGEAYLRQNKADEAYSIFMKISEAETPWKLNANYRLGEIFYYNNLGKVDYQKAFEYFSKASAHPQAYFLLGCMYYAGNYVPKDLKRAYGIFRELKGGHLEATFKYGYMSYMGEAGEPDYKEAFENLNAVRDIYVDACYLVGVMYFYGLYVNQDSQKALELFRHVLENNRPRAQKFLHKRAQHMIEMVRYREEGIVPSDGLWDEIHTAPKENMKNTVVTNETSKMTEKNVEVKVPKNTIEYTKNDVTRINKNIEIVKQMGLPYFSEQRVPSEKMVDLLDEKGMIENLIISYSLATLAATIGGKKDVERFDKLYNSMNYLYNLEHIYYDREKEIVQKLREGIYEDYVGLTWLYEKAAIYLWILSLAEFPSQDKECDVNAMNRMLYEIDSFDEVKAKIKVKSSEEILEKFDLLLRLRWAMEEARIKQEKLPVSLNGKVIEQQLSALGFVLNIMI